MNLRKQLFHVLHTLHSLIDEETDLRCELQPHGFSDPHSYRFILCLQKGEYFLIPFPGVVVADIDFCKAEVRSHDDVRYGHETEAGRIDLTSQHDADLLLYQGRNTTCSNGHLRGNLVECAFRFDSLESFNDIADLQIVEAVEADTAFKARVNFSRIIFEALE